MNRTTPRSYKGYPRMHAKRLLTILALLIVVPLTIIVLTPLIGGISQDELTPEAAAIIDVPIHSRQLSLARTAAGTRMLRWIGTGETDIQYYQLYRKFPSDEDWQPITTIEASEDNQEEYTWNDTITSGTTALYGVTAVNRYGKHSAMTTTTGSVEYLTPLPTETP